MSSGIKTSYDHNLTVRDDFFREGLSSCDKFLYNITGLFYPVLHLMMDVLIF